jgi:hypothetical protein
MADESDLQAISRMLASPHEATSRAIEQERVVCGSANLTQALIRIEELLAALASGAGPCRVALFSDDLDECSMIAAAFVARAQELGFSATLSKGDWGPWARAAAREAAKSTHSVHVLVAVPPQQKASEGFAAIAGGIVLLWPLAQAGSNLVPDGTEELILAPFAERVLDKAAHLIVATADALVAAEQEEEENRAGIGMLTGIDPGALLAVCIDPSRLAGVQHTKEAAERLAGALRAQAALRPGEPLNAVDLNRSLFPQIQRSATVRSRCKARVLFVRCGCGWKPRDRKSQRTKNSDVRT